MQQVERGLMNSDYAEIRLQKLMIDYMGDDVCLLLEKVDELEDEMQELKERNLVRLGRESAFSFLLGAIFAAIIQAIFPFLLSAFSSSLSQAFYASFQEGTSLVL